MLMRWRILVVHLAHLIAHCLGYRKLLFFFLVKAILGTSLQFLCRCRYARVSLPKKAFLAAQAGKQI